MHRIAGSYMHVPLFLPMHWAHAAAGLSVASMAAACCMHARISCMICMRYVDQASRGKAIRIPSGGAQLHILILILIVYSALFSRPKAAPKQESQSGPRKGLHIPLGGSSKLSTSLLVGACGRSFQPVSSFQFAPHRGVVAPSVRILLLSARDAGPLYDTLTAGACSLEQPVVRCQQDASWMDQFYGE